MDMGETAIDEATFNEYISEISSHYTADKVSSPRVDSLKMSHVLLQYHLLGNKMNHSTIYAC